MLLFPSLTVLQLQQLWAYLFEQQGIEGYLFGQQGGDDQDAGQEPLGVADVPHCWML